MENQFSELQVEEKSHPGKKLPQYIYAICATMGGMAAGSMIGWPAQAGPKLRAGEYSFEVNHKDEEWLGSISTLGPIVISFPIGYIMEKIGKKSTMILTLLPLAFGWYFIIWAQSLTHMLVGRFLIGVGSGAYCVLMPAYISEICQDDVKGSAGTMYELMFCMGILLAYTVGAYTAVKTTSLICAAIPALLGIMLIFMPETPYYLLTENKLKQARISMMKLRGKGYNCNHEMELIQKKIDEDIQKSTSILKSLSERSTIMALIICSGAMIYLQLSGFSAVLFNATEIFASSGTNIDAKLSTIITGVIQVLSTFISTFTVDRLGRRTLLLIAAVGMGSCTTSLGIYFYLLKHYPDTALRISWLPLVSVCLFLIFVSVGHGPIAWILPGEVAMPNVKSFVMSSAVFWDWVTAFCVTDNFLLLQESLGQSGAYWFFAIVTYSGFFFVYFLVPETKGKSVEEIQKILSGKFRS